jgi:hypothetical protein
MKLPNGLSLLIKDNHGGLCLAVYQPRQSQTWHWRVSFVPYGRWERRYFFRIDRAAAWARNNQWDDYVDLFWTIRFRIGHQLRQAELT